MTEIKRKLSISEPWNFEHKGSHMVDGAIIRIITPQTLIFRVDEPFYYDRQYFDDSKPKTNHYIDTLLLCSRHGDTLAGPATDLLDMKNKDIWTVNISLITEKDFMDKTKEELEKTDIYIFIGCLELPEV